MEKLSKRIGRSIQRKINPFKTRFRAFQAVRDYHQTIRQKKPYFGSVMVAGQLGLRRKSVMQRLLKKEMQKRIDAGRAPEANEPFRLVEVGSWAGASCIAWCEAAAEMNCPIIVYSIDPWEWYEKYLGLNDGANYRTMDEALATDKIFNLFLHNISTSGYRDKVKIMRGYSSDILPFLRPQSFDFIYIDGNHSYSFVSGDIQNAKSLVKEGGIISGDDFEAMANEIDFDFCQANAEKDAVRCPKTNKAYHPGVTLAIHREFNDNVFVEEGFWAVNKTPDGGFVAATL